jgi:hypothetical protein
VNDKEEYVATLRMLLSERREKTSCRNVYPHPEPPPPPSNAQGSPAWRRFHQALCPRGGTSTAPGASEIRPRANSTATGLRELVRDVCRLDWLVCRTRPAHPRSGQGVSGTSLTKIFGIGALLAAKIIGRVGSAARFPTKGHFASYTGTAPIEASSGDVIRHRLCRAGDRQLNSILCTSHRYLSGSPRCRGA